MNKETMKYNLSALFRTRHGMFFLAVLLVKVGAAVMIEPALYTKWFIPFIKNFIASGYHNPWDSFIANNGPGKAFPYGTGMLLIFSIPFALKSLAAGGLDAGVITWVDLFLFRIPLILADIGILYMLVRSLQLDAWKSMFIYWCSPVVFYIIYYHGQLDAVPMMIMFASIILLIDRRYILSALLLGFGIATKENLLFALPFFLAYLYRKENGRLMPSLYLAVTAAIYGALIGTVFFSEGYRLMVLGAEERTWIFLSSIGFGGFNIYLVPLAMTLLYLKFCMYSKLNKDIFVMYIGLGFTVLLLLIPSSAPGWYMWIIPFLCYYFICSRRFTYTPLLVFSALFLLFFLVRVPYPLALVEPGTISVLQAITGGHLPESAADKLVNLSYTFLQGSVAYIAFTMYMYGVRSNRIYKERKTPIIIGIGGNSGAGKDTLCNSLKLLLGKENILQADGDDHHKWERGHQMWKVYTHLNPKANDLILQFDNARSLKNGMTISRRTYDHDTGKFSESKPVSPGKYVLVSGLHPFYLRSMRDLIDIKISLDTEENLRNYWKINRDTKERGYSKEHVIDNIKKREEDSSRFIEPQKEHADIIIRYETKENLSYDDIDDNSALIIRFILDNSINLETLMDQFDMVPSLSVTHEYEGVDKQILTVDGTVSSQQIQEISLKSVLNPDEIVSPQVHFEDGLKGVVQAVLLIMVSHIKTYGKI